MRIAICDDEEVIGKELCGMVKKYAKESSVSVFTDGASLLQENGFDIVFLDIGMDGMNGMEVARRLREESRHVIIIFVTALKEYVFDSFEVGAFWYLLKPFEEEKLKLVLGRATEEWERNHAGKEKQIFVRTKNKNYVLPVRDILYLENQKRKILIHTRKEQITIYGTMAKMEEALGNGFYRCHRGYLVNFAYVAGYESESIRLINNETIYLARNKYQDFVMQYMRYLRNGGVSFV